jgi:tRNA threonylcarbamoyladenosine modification (KEOPS) complex  Pcc1 subunit
MTELTHFFFKKLKKLSKTAAAIFFLASICMPKMSQATTQNLSYNCSANAYFAATSPGDTLIVTLASNCILNTSADLPVNMSVTSIVDSGGNSKSITPGQTYVTGDVFTITVGTTLGVNSKMTFKSTVGAILGIYSVTPAVPVISSISPASVSTDGGVIVTLGCGSFQCWNNSTVSSLIRSVNVNGVDLPSTAWSATSAPNVRFVAPAGVAGPVDVVITNMNGSSSPRTFTYVIPPPTVTSVSPNIGPAAGGQTVTITGTNFTNASSVTINSVAVSSFTVTSNTTINAVTPAGAVATNRSIVVTTPNGSNSANTLYSYVSAPVVTSVNPNSGVSLGGTNITITGAKFYSPASVTIGGIAATNIAVVSATSITATTPAGTVGSASVLVSTASGVNSANTLFSYTNPSNDSNLSGLTLSSGALTPAFANNTITYTQSVANDVSSITVTPTVNQANATVTVNGTAAASGSASGNINLNVGANTITTVVTAQDGTTTKTYTTTVNREATPTLTFATPTSAAVTMGGSLTNAATSNYSGGSYGAISYASSAAGVATVNSSGVITPVSVGTAVITATQAAVAGVNAQATQTYTLTVNALPTPTLTFATPTSAAVTMGGSLTNAATSNYSGGSYGAISYASSAAGVATVNSSGVITPVSVGTAVITATQAALAGANAQATQTYTLTVIALPTPTLTFATPTSAAVTMGGYLTNAATSNYSGGSYGAISYASSAAGVATVDSSGVITPVSVGTAVITATQAAVAGVNAQATQTYTLTVNAATSTDANLSGLTISSGALTPLFANSTINYTLSVANSVSSITVTPTVNQANATVKVNGTTVNSGSASGSVNLNIGTNTITVVVTAQDGTTNKTYTTVVTREAPSAPPPPPEPSYSSDANLSGLVLSSGLLNPAFSTNTLTYKHTVENTVSSITVTPTVRDTTASVKVNGIAVASGNASSNINLVVGANKITVDITAEDGSKKTYSIDIIRAASSVAELTNINLSSGLLSPAFTANTLSYVATVPNTTKFVTLTPAVKDSTASVKVNGVSVASGSASSQINLNVGANTINTVVTAQDGTQKTYVTTVTRVASNVAELSNLIVSSGALSPSFAPASLSYSAVVPNTTTFVSLTPYVKDSTATIKINGIAVSSGNESGKINLNVGLNTISTVVTAEDGKTEKSYVLAITRSVPLIAQTNLVLVASPNVITSINKFSTLSTSGANGTGAVSFAVTKGGCKISANIVTAGAADEICEITATKAADSVYLATNATVNIQVRNSDIKKFAEDKSVSALQAAQLLQAQKFSTTQVQNIGNHLDSLRHSFNLNPSNFGIGINVPAFSQIAPVFYKIKEELAYKTEDSASGSIQFAQLRQLGNHNKPLKEFLNDFEDSESLGDKTEVNSGINHSVKESQTYSVWTAGTIDVGQYKTVDNQQTTSKFRASGLTLGLDYKIGTAAIVGAAIGYEASQNTPQINESKIKSNQKSLTGYGLFGLGNGWVLDGLLGAGDLTFNGDRYDLDDLSRFTMNRQGKSIFGSASIRKIFHIGGFKLSPFIKHDSIQNKFDTYDEKQVTGSPTNYALRYDKSSYLTTAVASGFLITHDTYLESGKLMSTAKISRNQVKSGAFNQDIYFADLGEASGIYTLKQTGIAQKSTSLDLGLVYASKGGDILEFGWRVAVGGNQYKLNGLRFGIRVPI